MEILVACDARGVVPKPGRRSFTSVLVRTIEKGLQRNKEVNIKWLSTAMWDEHSDLIGRISDDGMEESRSSLI